jgi:hypothetical protein
MFSFFQHELSMPGADIIFALTVIIQCLDLTEVQKWMRTVCYTFPSGTRALNNTHLDADWCCWLFLVICVLVLMKGMWVWLNCLFWFLISHISTYDAFDPTRRRYFAMVTVDLHFHPETAWLCTQRYWHVLECHVRERINKFSIFTYAIWWKGLSHFQ